jgi:endo-1,4-beta-xylanase
MATTTYPIREAHLPSRGSVIGWVALLPILFFCVGGVLIQESGSIELRKTKEADPAPLRILNLNNAERQEGLGDRTRAATLTLIQQLLKRGVPVQAIGLQGHLRAPYTANHAPFIRFVSQLRELGLQVLVTELDINDIDVKGDAAQVRSVVASSYANFLSTLIPAAQPKRIIFGTPTDRYSWYDQSAKTNPGYRRSDGAPHYAGLLDGSLNASPALSSVRAAVAQFRRTGA